MRADAACALLLLAAGCGGDPRADELACQQRLVAAFEGPQRENGTTGAFADLARRFETVDTAGCNEGQRGRARSMAALAGRVGEAWQRLDRLAQHSRIPETVDAPQFRELQALMEQFAHRRDALFADLRRMQAGSNGMDAANAQGSR
ncbi:MAG: hypothetical protein QOC65_148 [Sphingomonadales bacterium]|nr:hypothetical protein [Sphingomonadales bacterium]